MSHKKYRKETDCLNCGAEVQGKFCSNCGQENLETKENFFHLSFHFISDYFHFDSKFFRSMIPLFSKPGFLTKQYWEGKRVMYIHPLRLYFFAIIVAVLCTNFFYSNYDGIKGRIIQTSTEYVPDSADMKAAGESPDSLAYLEQLRIVNQQRAAKLIETEMGVGVDQFMHHLKYISFFLLPVYALVFKILYTRRKSFYVDHLVYTMHLQSFAMLLMGLMLLIPLLYPASLTFVTRLTYFLIFVYVAISLRSLYQQSWLKTILKSLIASVMIVAMLVCVMGLYMGIRLMTGDVLDNLNSKDNVEQSQTEKK